MPLNLRNQRLQKVIQVILLFFLTAILAALTLFVGNLAWQKYIDSRAEIKAQVTDEEKKRLTPKLKVNVRSEKKFSAYKLPLKLYALEITDSKENLVPVLGATIELVFPFDIVEVKHNILVPGPGVTVGGLRQFEEKGGVRQLIREDLPIETPQSKKYFLDIRQIEFKGKVVNTNVAVFSCEEWQETALFLGQIVVDLSTEPERSRIVTNPDMIGKYRGKYYFEIKSKRFSENIEGNIPRPPTIEIRLSREFQDLDPNHGNAELTISAEVLFEKNGRYFNILPPMEKGVFQLHIIRDKDNAFKARISNSFSKDVILKYDDLDKLKTSPNHPKHTIGIMWGNGQNRLYFDRELVDTYPTKKNK